MSASLCSPFIPYNRICVCAHHANAAPPTGNVNAGEKHSRRQPALKFLGLQCLDSHCLFLLFLLGLLHGGSLGLSRSGGKGRKACVSGCIVSAKWAGKDIMSSARPPVYLTCSLLSGGGSCDDMASGCGPLASASSATPASAVGSGTAPAAAVPSPLAAVSPA